MNEIRAEDKSVRQVLDNVKYVVDFFQRDYRWEKKHIEQLIIDLTNKFTENYDETDTREEVEKYERYFLGPIVLSKKDEGMSIIDGQQRLTSITLLLIYLNNLQKDRADRQDFNNLIFSEKYSKKSFNIQIPDRRDCIEALYNGKSYDPTGKGPSVRNIVERYHDIEELFPDDLKKKALPYFIDWIRDNVVFVQVLTYSDEDAYTIFETMNDRGLNLTPSEMLKGYLLQFIKDEGKKVELNEVWKNEINELDGIAKDENLKFFMAWLRAKYAESIRPGKIGATNEDFEKIGTRFHNWVKDNKEKKMGLSTAGNYSDFIIKDMKFYTGLYRLINASAVRFSPNSGLESIYFINERGLAPSIYFPLLMSSIKPDDKQETVMKKLSLVSKYLEMFIVFRSLNYRNYAHSGIRYTMYTLVKEIRNKNVDELAAILKHKASQFDETLDGANDFSMHVSGQNKRFVRFLLARITTYIEENSLVPTNFETYTTNWIAKPFQVEHVWSDQFERHKDEFDQRDEFEKYRNKLGALLLLPEGFNQSFGALSYEEKLPHYFGQNLLAKSLCPQCYDKNPNFIKFKDNSGLPFNPHDHFKKQDIDERQRLYHKILERIYDQSIFDKISSS